MADLKQVELLANQLMQKHGLSDWTFSFDKAKVRFGVCDYKHKKISMSKELTELNPLEDATDTILHEIAHALCSKKDGHGPVWRAKCREIGARPSAYNTNPETKQPKGKHTYKCPCCEREVQFYRETKRKKACGICCVKHNNGRFSEKYVLVKV